GVWMCVANWATCSPIDPQFCCVRCGLPQRSAMASCARCAEWGPEFESCSAAFVFDGPVRGAVHRLKYRGEYARAEWCGQQMAAHIEAANLRCDALTPVPLHRKRERERGFNQSERLAQEISARSGIPL